MRRFEFVQGNEARFWSIARRGAVVSTVSGRIGAEGKSRDRELVDYMAAEQEYDRLVRDHLRRGYVEVAEASTIEGTPSDRRLTLQRVDGKGELALRGAATRYLVWRMIEVEVVSRDIVAPDLERWAQRAGRRLRLAEIPPPGAEGHDAWWQGFLELSAEDRARESGVNGVVGAYKLLDGSHWILTGRECALLADATRNRAPRRHKTGALHEQWLAEWTAFLDGAAKHGGAVVVAEE